MSTVIKDIYFLNIEDAYVEAFKQQFIVEANGQERLQYCYYDGPLTDIVLENFIQVEQDRFVEFFSHNHLPLPQLLGLSQEDGVVFNEMPADILDEIQQQRAGYKISEYIHFDSYFVDPLKALNVAKQKNRIFYIHPIIDSLQICYYRGELPEHSIANLQHLELENFEEFFIRSRMRIPENLEVPEELEIEVKATVKAELNRLIGEVKRTRNALTLQLITKARATQPRLLVGEKPRIFVPANRLTTVMQYSSQGMAKVFADLGWQVLLYIEANEMQGANLVEMLKQYIDFAPHACFQINNINNTFMHPDVVNIIWWQDLMVLKQRQPLKWRANDYNFSISPVFDDYLRDCQATSVKRLHFVIDEQVFHNRTTAAREDKIVFVGSSYIKVLNFADPQHSQAVERLLAVMRQGGCFDQQTVAQIAAETDLDYDFVFWKLLHYVIRDHAVKWLCADSTLPVEIYGRFWGEDSEVAEHFHGELPHGDAVADVYRSARYALVCHPFEINSQRLAEVAACGCIPLVYDCRDVAEGPFWEDHCLFFKTAEQLQQIIRQGLQPKLAPEGLAANFTYKDAARRVIEHTGLNHLPVIAAEACGDIVSLLSDGYANGLRLQSSDPEILQQCQENLHSNLCSLEQHRPALHDYLLQIWQQADIQIRLEQPAGNELWQIAITHDAQLRYTFDNIDFLQHKRMIAENTSTMRHENTCCYALVGLGAGYELLEIFKATENPIPEMAEFEVAIYLLESNPAFWLLNLLLHDLQPLLSAARVRIVDEADYQQQLLTEFSKFEAPLPDMLFALDRQRQAMAGQLFDLIEQSKQSRAERHQHNLREVATYYAEIGMTQWQQKFKPENVGQLRVMGFISRFSSFLKYCMRDWLDGFDRLGAATLTCIESENYYLTTIEQLIDDINRFKPDMILTIDHFRHEYEGIPENVPFVNWIQDMLPNIVGNQTALQARDFTFVFSKHWLGMNGSALYQQFPFEYLPLGFNDHYYHPLSARDYQYDFLVISHLIEPEKTLLPIRRKQNLPWYYDEHETLLLNSHVLTEQQLRAIYQLLVEHTDLLTLNQFHAFCIDNQTNGFLEVWRLVLDAGIDIGQDAINQLMAGACTRFHYDYLTVMKIRPLELLIDSIPELRLGLYGRNWDKIPKLTSYAHGIAENGLMINRLMNRSKICFNSSPGTTLHMRALEIMASGAFMLSKQIYNDTAPLSEYYTAEEQAFYQDEDDMVKMVEFYLNHESIRGGIAERAYRKTVELFSYQTIAGRVLNSISARFDNSGL